MADPTDLGRAVRCYANAYNRNRVHDSQFWMGQKIPVVLDVNGVAGSGVTVTSVKWRVLLPYVAVMSNPRILSDNRSVAVDVLANWIGDTSLKCLATLSDGSVVPQLYRIDVSGDPFNLPTQAGSGPTEVTA